MIIWIPVKVAFGIESMSLAISNNNNISIELIILFILILDILVGFTLSFIKNGTIIKYELLINYIILLII